MPPFPPVPQAHGLTSKTFTFPPLDGTLTLPEIFDFAAEHSSNHTVFLYPNDDDTVEHVNYTQVVRGIQRVGRVLSGLNLPPPAPGKTIAIFAQLETISYFTLIHGIIRAGYVPFPLSPRNSAAAVAHLLLKTRSEHLFVSSDALMQKVAADAISLLHADPAVDLTVTCHLPPVFDELYAPLERDDHFDFPPAPKPDLGEVALYLHSSGTMLPTSDLYFMATDMHMP